MEDSSPPPPPRDHVHSLSEATHNRQVLLSAMNAIDTRTNQLSEAIDSAKPDDVDRLREEFTTLQKDHISLQERIDSHQAFIIGRLESFQELRSFLAAMQSSCQNRQHLDLAQCRLKALGEHRRKATADAPAAAAFAAAAVFITPPNIHPDTLAVVEKQQCLSCGVKITEDQLTLMFDHILRASHKLAHATETGKEANPQYDEVDYPYPLLPAVDSEAVFVPNDRLMILSCPSCHMGFDSKPIALMLKETLSAGSDTDAIAIAPAADEEKEIPPPDAE